MLFRKVTKANYRYFGEDGEFFKHGDTYYLTVREFRFLWHKYVEVTCRHGYKDRSYPDLPVILYADRYAFDDEWSQL